MRMIVKAGRYWIECESPTAMLSTEEDGKWVAFIRRAYGSMTKGQRQTLINAVDRVAQALPVGRAWITNDLDFALFFTTADRFEIWNAKQLVMQEIGISDTDLIWKAHFETDDDWENRGGLLWLVSELASTYQHVADYHRSGRHDKARRIQQKEIVRLLTWVRRRILEERVMNRNSMVITPSFPTIDYETELDMAFVIMPFNEKWSDDVYFLIKEAGEAEEMRIVRSDDIFSPDIVINDIWKLINRAGLVFADITTHNANVFYELGICHTLGKKVVLLRQDGGESAPFDIAYWRYFNYGSRYCQL